MYDRGHYLDTFKVSIPAMDRLIAAAMAHGGSFSDLYFEFTTYLELSLRDGIVNKGSLHEDYGVGIRVLCEEKTGYAYSESTEPADMMAAAKAAAIIAASVSPADVEKGKKMFRSYGVPAVHPDFYPQKTFWRENGYERFVPMLKEIEKRILEKDPRAQKVIVRLNASEGEIMMYNSFGELSWDYRPVYSLLASAVFDSPDGKSITTSGNRSFRMGPESLYDSTDSWSKIVDDVVEGVVKDVDTLFEAKRPKGGRMPVVMGAGASGILLHEAMGHAFEADFIRKGSSIFTGRMGQQICPKGINIVDDATIVGNRGACNFDDEGVMGQKTYMVRDGRLENFLHDRISAAHFGVAPTGNGRREDFRCMPVPRMRATYMESGPCRPDDIISSVGKGIFVDEFSNGQVKIGEGDFTFYVKSGRMIENGRLTMPVKDINIIGNGPQALSDILMVGNDARIEDAAWTCGKEQSAQVSCGMPTVLVKELTVGGE